MGKKIVTLVLALFCIAINSQEKLLDILPLSDGKVAYSGEGIVTGVNAPELHKRALEWFHSEAKDEVRSISNETDNQILGSGKYKIRARGVGLVGYNMEILYHIEINLNSGKYTYLIHEVIGTTEGKFELIKKPIENWNDDYQNEKKQKEKNQKVYPQVDEGMRQVIESLTSAMSGN